ncbi:hypothetical protein [Marinobacter nauticus]
MKIAPLNGSELSKISLLVFASGITGGISLYSQKYWALILISSLTVFYISTKTRTENQISWQSLSQSKTLFDSSAFRLTITLASVLALGYTIIDSTLNPNLTFHEELLEHLTPPALIIGASLPIVALLANHHRSIQTAHQIDNAQKSLEISEEQNLFSNFIKHKEMFDDIFKNNQLFNIENVFADSDIIYDQIYPEALDGNLRSSNNFNEKLKHLEKSIQESVKQIEKNPNTWLLSKEEISGALLQIREEVHRLGIIRIKYQESILDDKSYVVEQISRMQKVMIDINKCLNFALPSKSKNSMSLILSSLANLKVIAASKN